MNGSLYRKIGFASLIMMASVFLSRVVGLFREMTIACIGGRGGEVDAYQVAFILPEILNHVVASGFLSVTFIPIFSRYLVLENEDEAWKVFSVILTVFGILLTAGIVVAMAMAPQLVGLLAPGLTDPGLTAQAVRMTRIILPAQVFFFAGGMFTAVQFAKGYFFIPALMPLIYNGAIIAGGLVLGPYLGMEGFSWGVSAGALLGAFLLQLAGARRAGLSYRWILDLRHPDLRRYILLTLPLMLGLTMTFSTEIFMKLFGSFLPRGGIAALNYAFRVMLILVGFFGQAVGVASFPFMARLAAENKIAEMNAILNTTLRYLAVVIPFSVLLVVLRREVILILFQRGQFQAADTAFTAQVLGFLLVGAFAFAAQTIVSRGYYATQNTVYPAVFGTIAVLLSLPLYYLGLVWGGINGIALAVSLSAILQVGLLYHSWNRRSRNPQSAAVYRVLGKTIAASVLLGAGLEWLRILLAGVVNSATFAGSLATCLLIFPVFVIMLVLLGYVFRLEEISAILGKLAGKLTRRAAV